MKVVLGADHGGWQMKEEIKEWLEKERYEVVDVGAVVKDPEDDYVDFAVLVANEILQDDKTRGILFCRNGFGMVMAANRFPKVRCGFGFDVEAVKRGRTDDDINSLTIPADYVDLEQVKGMIKAFLETKFSGKERYERRLFKLKLIR